MDSLSTSMQCIEKNGNIQELVKAVGIETLKNMAFTAMLESGCFEMCKDRLYISSKSSISSIAGFVFESFIAN